MRLLIFKSKTQYTELIIRQTSIAYNNQYFNIYYNEWHGKYIKNNLDSLFFLL